jgi:AraC-like DNA-binding protein
MAVALVLDQPDLISPGRSRRVRYGAGTEAQISILNGRGRTFSGGTEAGALSLKWMPRGSADYESVRHHFRLKDSVQLLLNPGAPYRLRFRETSESFSVSFSRSLADDAWASLVPGDKALPEFPTLASRSPAGLQKQMLVLYEEAHREEPDGEALIEGSLATLNVIVNLVRERRGRADRVPALRNSTREELLRRLARAESYLIDCGPRATIEGAAASAALSPFHLIRVFRAVHEETPLAYGTRIALERARDALLMTADPVETIARRAGYESRTAFDRAFRRRFGTPPGSMRVAR